MPGIVFTNVVGTPLNPQFCEVLWKGSCPWSNGGVRELVQIYHFRKVSGSGIDVASAIGAAVMTELDGVLAAALSDQYTGTMVTARYMDDPTVAEVDVDTPQSGAVTGDRTSLFNTAVIQVKTVGRGRNYRGSKHFAPIAESQTTKDELNAGAITLWDAVRDGIRGLATGFTTASGSSWQLVVLSRDLSDLEANPAVFSGADATIASKLNAKVGTMKRRKERSGVA